ncbi:ABC transporter permease [Sediminicoccus sp. KRV36]|uniref:ABC transporter permease n=1 Tax=Sediminicoccus sp. KRV36 TaxID=3133721 RepID=UPI00200E7086|nr:ABC transporter permease [Sediminicoccus rosea]UPY38765.1 ABC transporter permease [Sediminicoccus rosea]
MMRAGELPRQAGWALLGVALILGAWQGLVNWAGLPEVLLPAPRAVLDSLWRSVGILPRHAGATAFVALGGFALAILAGTAIAAVMALSVLVSRMLYPNLLIFQLLPKVALGPLFVVWLGIGVPSLLAFATFVSVFPVAIGTLTGLKSADPGLIRLSRSLGASEWQMFRHIRLPGALPFFFAGAKVAATMAVTGAVVGEFISARAGLGWLVTQAAARADTALMFAALAVLAALGAALYGLVCLAEAAARRRWGTAA